MLLISIVGCQTDKVEVDTSLESMYEPIEFERVNLEDLSKDTQTIMEEAKSEKGYKILDDSSNEYMYLAVFAGQKSSSGYSVEITKVEVSEEKTKVTVKQIEPTKDSDVASILTYPMDIVKLQEITNDIELKYIEDSNDSDISESNDSNVNPDTPVSNSAESSTLLETQIVIAEYVGQIDNNSIEVLIEDGPQALRLNGMAKEQLSELDLDQEDLVELEVFTNEHDQLAVYSIKIPSL